MGSAWVIQQGDDRPAVWNLTNPDGTPANVDGYSARAQVRERAGSDVVLHEWSTGAGTAVFSESTLVLKVDDSENWTWNRGVYDVQIVDPVGATEVIDPPPGERPRSVVVLPAVTR